MGSSTQQAGIDAWLRAGGIVVTASDRTARALTAAFHRARRSEGLAAWTAPEIHDFASFARGLWRKEDRDARLLLNLQQEESLWEQIAGREPHPATVLHASRRRVAALAAYAHELIATHSPRYLKPAERVAWQQDAASFSGWLKSFDEICRANRFVSACRIPLELVAVLERGNSPARPPLLITGFDRILPAQRMLFDAWGEWHGASQDEFTSTPVYHAAADEQSELAACARWCRESLDSHPRSRLLIVARNVQQRRGELERALLNHLGAPSFFEFSLGVPLSRVDIAGSAVLLLRWLGEAIDEAELDWLLSTGCASASRQENGLLQRAMRGLRRRDDQRPQWTLDAFCSHSLVRDSLPPAWLHRMRDAEKRLTRVAGRAQSPVEWASLAPQLLQALGWPGSRPLTSLEFQAARRFQQSIDACASLGFDGRRTLWTEFLSSLIRALEETLFAPESHDAPIQIVGPAESAGLTADSVWFLGADEDAWPAAGSTHPFLPPHVQRESGMPHASTQLDWQLAEAITRRLLASAPDVRFSYARQKAGVETRPSRLVSQFTGPPLSPADDALGIAASLPATVPFEDASRVPFSKPAVAAGSSVLTAQSLCPFKAFATVRLGARGWDAASNGLTPRQRGQLVHAVLHDVWAGPPDGIRTLDQLRALPDRSAFVAGHVQRVMDKEIRFAARMPRRYLDLEKSRLTRLIEQWLEYESERHAFTIHETEWKQKAAVAGLLLDVRLDRIDRLNDGSLLVVDYKTGNVKPGAWDPPRPDDVQLPLYAVFALDAAQVGGLVFGKVRAGDDRLEFVGRLRNATATLSPALGSATNLVRKPLDMQQLDEWRSEIEALAAGFIAGRAEADPRDYPKTCTRCDLPVLCRIHENRASSPAGDDDEDEGADDE